MQMFNGIHQNDVSKMLKMPAATGLLFEEI